MAVCELRFAATVVHALTGGVMRLFRRRESLKGRNSRRE